MNPLIIGHRGASASAPENTLAAFERALQDGADGIEFDVRRARDGVPVVIHDATLKRTGLRHEAVAALSSAELSEIDVGSWFNRRFPARARAEFSEERVPTLAHVLEIVGGRCRALYVEMKCDLHEAHALASEVVKAIQTSDAARRIIVESFTLEAIREIKRLAPEIRTAALFERSLTRPLPLTHQMLAQAREACADEIALHRTLVSRRTVEAAHREGMNVVVWTVDHPSWIKRAQTLKLHALITNHPARMRAAETLND